MNEEVRKQLMEAKTDEEKRAILEAHSGELSDEELEKVSAGCDDSQYDCVTVEEAPI